MGGEDGEDMNFLQKDEFSKDISPPVPTPTNQVDDWMKVSIDVVCGKTTLLHNPDPRDDNDE